MEKVTVDLPFIFRVVPITYAGSRAWTDRFSVLFQAAPSQYFMQSNGDTAVFRESLVMAAAIP